MSAFVWQNDTNFMFFCLSKVWRMLHHGSIRRVHNIKVTLCFHLLFFCLFFIIKCFFNYLLYHFIIISFFQIKYQISATEYINISETGIGGPKFLVELHGIFETNATTPLTWVDEKLSLDQSTELGIFWLNFLTLKVQLRRLKKHQ